MTRKHAGIFHDDKNIKGFFEEYRWMSNFYLCPVMWKGLLFPSSENAYQAAKSNDPKLWLTFLNIEPKEAKKLGRNLPIRKDWEDVKEQIMYDVCLDKFLRTKALSDALIATGDKYLQEANWWGDVYWGVCRGIGLNKLGQCLMRVRDKLNTNEQTIYKGMQNTSL